MIDDITNKFKKSGEKDYISFLKKYEKEYINLFPELYGLKVDVVHVLYLIHYLSEVGQHDPNYFGDSLSKISEEQKVISKAFQKGYNLGLQSLSDVVRTSLLNEFKKSFK